MLPRHRSLKLRICRPRVKPRSGPLNHTCPISGSCNLLSCDHAPPPPPPFLLLVVPVKKNTHIYAATTVRSRATVLGLISGLYRGVGLGVGAMFGGYLYSGLGASLCFRVCSVLPFISLLLLALPTAQTWLKCSRNRWRKGMGERGLEGWGSDDKSSELDPVSLLVRMGLGGTDDVSVPSLHAYRDSLRDTRV